jgi:hypothetical protein
MNTLRQEEQLVDYENLELDDTATLGLLSNSSHHLQYSNTRETTTR